ncbi:MAG: hypothetical protein LBI84_10375, partial [Propionibacteriaceae bacterium]|nr:hypothetical protein [Propionibacteriaceae bacterium]
MKRVWLLILAFGLAVAGLGGCEGDAAPSGAVSDTAAGALGNGWQPTGALALTYAQNFHIDYYEGGLTLVSIYDGSRFLILPEGAETPSGIASDITVLHRPVTGVYLAATAVMSLFIALDSLA